MKSLVLAICIQVISANALAQAAAPAARVSVNEAQSPTYKEVRNEYLKGQTTNLYFLTAYSICSGKGLTGENIVRCEEHNNLRIQHIEGVQSYVNCLQGVKSKEEVLRCYAPFGRVFNTLVNRALQRPIIGAKVPAPLPKD